jgi:membrane protease YdiL (CAAX protease family)
MQNSSPTRPAVSTFTWAGLIIALFAMLVVRQAVLVFFHSFTTTTTIWRESLHWLCAAVLLVIVKRGERLPFRSVGIGTRSFARSLGWGALIALACLIVGFGIAVLTRFNGGPSGEALAKLPVWLLILVVLRAGIVEELFYRGYAIERLQTIGLNKYWAAAIPLLIFSLGHWKGGWANIIIALALGAILSIFYLWRRDLVANMIGHFTVDFIGVVMPRLLHHF